MWYAIDFGTSNSLVSCAKAGEAPILLNLESDQPVLRSLIFTPEKDEYFFGAEAIEAYQERGGEGRFFRSLKKFLPEPGFKGTEVFGRRMKIEELIAIFLRELKKRADRESGFDGKQVVLGRPALYSLDLEKDQLAEDRMRLAAELAGFERIEFCPEPLAAGLNQEKGDADEVILVCDFGGGTSDFTLLQTGSQDFKKEDVLGLSGVFVAGDAFDGRLMRDFISTEFGKDVKYQTPVGNNTLTFPRGLLTKLCNPAHIFFLKERETWEFLKGIQKWTVEGDNERYIDQLFCLVEEDLGYPLYDKIERSKIDLGNQTESLFEFKHSNIHIEMPLERSKFEKAAQVEMDKIFGALDKVFEQSGLKKEEVSKVSLTGGTAQMPLVQERLKLLFGAEKMEMSEVFQSVALGLGKFAKSIS